MFGYRAAVAITMMLAATVVSGADAERTSFADVVAAGADSRDVLPVVGGGIELHACRDVGEDGPYTIVEFGPAAAEDASGVQVTVDAAPAGACSHLVIFTQPEPTQAL